MREGGTTNEPVEMKFSGGSTTRESQVIAMAAHGLTDKEISARLGISHDTVSTYWRRILARYSASSRTEVIALVIRSEADLALASAANEIRQLRSTIEVQRELLREGAGGSEEAVSGTIFLDSNRRVLSVNRHVVNLLQLVAPICEDDLFPSRIKDIAAAFENEEEIERFLALPVASHQAMKLQRAQLKRGVELTLERRATQSADWSGELIIIQRFGSTPSKSLFSVDGVAEHALRFISATERSVLDEAIQGILATLGAAFEADRAYVFRVDHESRTVTNTHEWTATGISAEIDHLQAVPFELIGDWVDRLTFDGGVEIAHVAALEKEESLKRLLEQQGITSLVVRPIRGLKSGTVIGFVGFDSVRGHWIWDQRARNALADVAAMIAHAHERIPLK